MNIPAPILKLLHDEPAPVQESAAQHVRNCIQLLLLAEARVSDVLMGGDAALLDLLRRAEVRAFHALFELGQETP